MEGGAGAWAVCRFKREFGKKEGGECFWQGLIPQMHTIVLLGLAKYCFQFFQPYDELFKIKILLILLVYSYWPKDCKQNFASNIKRNWAIQSFFSDEKSGQKQNLAMMPYKTYQQNFFLTQILTIQGVGSLVESIKKGEFMTKIFFQTMFIEV